MMWAVFKPALRLLMVLTILTGVIYPLMLTGIAQFVFPCAGQREPDRSERPTGWIALDRPAV